MLFDVLQPVAAQIHTAWVATPKTTADPTEEPITVETHAGATVTLELHDGARVMLDFERGFGLHGEQQSILNVDGSMGGLSWEWCPPFENGKPTVSHYVDVDGKIEKRVEVFREFGWDDVHWRPLLSFIDLIHGRSSVITPPRQLEFNYRVFLGIYKCAEKGEPVEIRLKEEKSH